MHNSKYLLSAPLCELLGMLLQVSSKLPVVNNSLAPKHSEPEGVPVSFSVWGSYPSLSRWWHFQHGCSWFEKIKPAANTSYLPNHLPRHFHLGTLSNKLQIDLLTGQAVSGMGEHPDTNCILDSSLSIPQKMQSDESRKEIIGGGGGRTF